MTTVLVPLDGSTLAERALAYALPIARAVGGRLRLVQACVPVDPGVQHSGAAVRMGVAAHVADLHDARTAMETRVGALSAEGLVVDGIVGSGGATDVILEEVESANAELVVMSTHGRGGLGRLLFGSVADDVLRRATVPILLVPPAARPPLADGRPRRVLVALDGSELAEASLGPAAELARAFGVDLVLLRVVDPPDGLGRHAFVGSERGKARRYLNALVKRLRLPRGEVATRVRVGPVVPTIAATATEVGADVIALGTHGRSGLSRLVMGSVATGLVEHAAVPLLLVSTAVAHRADADGAPRRARPLGRGPACATEHAS